MSNTATARNLEAVRTICERWNELGPDDFRALFADGCEYRNVPIAGDLHVGPDAIHTALSRVRVDWDVECAVVHISCTGDVVLTERHERFIRRDGTKPTFDLPVMGAFELRDGKVVAWRDYFDLSHMKFA